MNWEALGITGENNFLKLYYDNYPNTLIAHFYRAIGLGYGLKSLWAQRASEKIYSRLSRTGEQLRYEDPVLSPSSPHLYTNVLRVQSRDGQYEGYEWQSIERINLNTGLTETINRSEGMGIKSPLEKTRENMDKHATRRKRGRQRALLLCSLPEEGRGRGPSDRVLSVEIHYRRGEIQENYQAHS
jgi:hypothetical protein